MSRDWEREFSAELRGYLPAELAGLDLRCMAEIDSTNTYLKKEALKGAADRTVAVANRQTGGRGRQGRGFLSPAGKGVYLSVLLRSKVPAGELMKVTGMAAVAVCRAVEQVSGAELGIKWVNDLVLGGRKLCGILGETAAVEGETALIIGAGVNVDHGRGDFTPEVAELATSLAMEGYRVSRAELAAAMLRELAALGEALGGDTSSWTDFYRRRCVNLGKAVKLLWSESGERAMALDVDDRFGLVIRREDGTTDTIRTGEVSVRGLYGYID